MNPEIHRLRVLSQYDVCPTCDAAAGHSCRTPRGRETRTIHPKRPLKTGKPALSDFDQWWHDNLEGVIFDALQALPVQPDEATVRQFQHIALQGWLAALQNYELTIPAGGAEIRVATVGGPDTKVTIQPGYVNQGMGHGYPCFKIIPPEGYYASADEERKDGKPHAVIVAMLMTQETALKALEELRKKQVETLETLEQVREEKKP